MNDADQLLHGFVLEPTTQSDIMPKEDTGAEQRLVSNVSTCTLLLLYGNVI